ncbi:hypothetical protein JCM3774_003385 [Rhodotorula dairenensis]
MPLGVDAGTSAASVPALPALARLRHDLHQERKPVRSDAVDRAHPSNGEGSHPEAKTPGSVHIVAAHSSPGAGSPRQQQHHPASTVASATRRLGLLGIPISSSEGGDDDDDDEDEMGCVPSAVMSTDSLEGNPPGSPAVAIIEPPAATYSRGGSTRSGQSTKSGEGRDAGAFVTEESFRDIVDELTLQNQRLKQRLKRFESARVPNNLRNERLFEIRFFDGLPKQRRREIESFLTDYVQTYSSSGDHGSSSSSRINVTGGSSTQDHTESTSSIGATLRSLRSSEKELLAKEAMAAALQGASVSADQSASVSGSGSGSGGAPDRKIRDRRKDSILATEPLGSIPSPTAALPDPPPLLRRPTDIFPPERDVLAAPSFSGPEPRSLTGTGSGMRISDPTSKKRRRTPVAPTAPPSPERTSRLRQTASFDGSITSDSAGTPDPDRLEGLLVEMLERLFYECLPVDGAEEVPPAAANPLHSDPQPLPPQSSTNTQYLRTMLFSEETQKSGGYLYLNLLATMAGLHRLNVSVGTVRHALRTKSQLIEVSAEGNKIRWKGPLSKPRPEPDDVAEPEIEMGDMEDNSIEATRMEDVEQAERRRDVREQRLEAPVTVAPAREDATSTRSSGDRQTSMFDGRHRFGGATTISGSGQDPSRSKGSTAPTSLMPSGSGDSKNGSSSNSASRGSRDVQTRSTDGGAAGAVPASTSCLRHAVEELSSAGASAPGEGVASVDVLGSAVGPPATKRVLYTPLFVRRNDPASDAESEDADAASDNLGGSDGHGHGHERPAKRRKDYEGGVVFFANDLFYSDLAGDLAARTSLLKETVRDDSESFQAILGDSSSVEAEWSSRTGSAGGGTSLLSRSRSSASPAVADPTSGFEHLLPPRKPLSALALDEAKSSTGASGDAMSAVSSVSGEPDRDADFTSWDSVDDLAIAPAVPDPALNREYDIFRVTPKPSLQLSAMHDVVAADHFTMHVKLFYPRRDTSALRVRAPLPRRARPVVSASSFAPHYPAAAALAPYQPQHLVTHTLNHHPSVRVRFPRLRLRESSISSDTDGEVRSAGATGSASPTSSQLRRLPSAPGADYLMSLSLPFNAWAPETRRPSESDERASEAIGSRTGTCESLIVID